MFLARGRILYIPPQAQQPMGAKKRVAKATLFFYGIVGDGIRKGGLAKQGKNMPQNANDRLRYYALPTSDE